MRKKARVCPVLIERGGHIIKSEIVASDNEEPARISMRMRDKIDDPLEALSLTLRGTAQPK